MKMIGVRLVKIGAQCDPKNITGFITRAAEKAALVFLSVPIFQD